MKNKYSQKEQLSEGVYVFEDGNKIWGGEMNHNFELLNESLKTKTLTVKVNDEIVGEYNNTEDKEINIPLKEITLNDIDNLFTNF